MVLELPRLGSNLSLYKFVVQLEIYGGTFYRMPLSLFYSSCFSYKFHVFIAFFVHLLSIRFNTINACAKVAEHFPFYPTLSEQEVVVYHIREIFICLMVIFYFLENHLFNNFKYFPQKFLPQSPYFFLLLSWNSLGVRPLITACLYVFSFTNVMLIFLLDLDNNLE